MSPRPLQAQRPAPIRSLCRPPDATYGFQSSRMRRRFFEYSESGRQIRSSHDNVSEKEPAGHLKLACDGERWFVNGTLAVSLQSTLSADVKADRLRAPPFFFSCSCGFFRILYFLLLPLLLCRLVVQRGL